MSRINSVSLTTPRSQSAAAASLFQTRLSAPRVRPTTPAILTSRLSPSIFGRVVLSIGPLPQHPQILLSGIQTIPPLGFFFLSDDILASSRDVSAFQADTLQSRISISRFPRPPPAYPRLHHPLPKFTHPQSSWNPGGRGPVFGKALSFASLDNGQKGRSAVAKAT